MLYTFRAHMQELQSVLRTIPCNCPRLAFFTFLKAYLLCEMCKPTVSNITKLLSCKPTFIAKKNKLIYKYIELSIMQFSSITFQTDRFALWNSFSVDAWPPRPKFCSQKSLKLNSRPTTKLIAVENPKTNTIPIIRIGVITVDLIRRAWMSVDHGPGRQWTSKKWKAPLASHMTRRTINQF